MSAPGQGFGAGRHQIEGIGGGGFLFGGTSHVGSILALPSGVYAWKVSNVAEITTDSLAPVIADAHALDFLLIGTGQKFTPLPPAVAVALREAGIRYEIMATSAAAQTYNVLLAEDRRVGAALLAVA